jgi:hypothetical protein
VNYVKVLRSSKQDQAGRDRGREEEGIQNGIVKKVLEVLLTSNNIWLYGCGGVNEKEATIIKYHN